MGVRITSRGWLFVIVLVLALVDVFLITALFKPSVASIIINAVSNAVRFVSSITHRPGAAYGSLGRGGFMVVPAKPQPLVLPVTAYVVGSGRFISGLVGLGQLSSLPNDSIVIIDWDFVNETMHDSLNQLAEQLEGVVGRGDLVILYTENPGQVPMLEDAIAVAWGNHYKSKVIGYPVMHVNSSAYVVGFGGRNYLVISPVQVSGEYTVTLNGLISYWVQINKVTTDQLPLRNMDSTYYDVDLCRQTLEAIQSNNLNQWFFGTGVNTIMDTNTGNEYVYDYCITGVYEPSGSPADIPVEYLGFNNIVVGSNGGGGDWGYYNVGINMTAGYYIDQENGYNSYMSWTGTPDAAQPGSTSCSSFNSPSTLEVVEQIALEVLEFIYDAALESDPSSPVYSLTASLSIVNGPYVSSGILSSLTWSIGVENQNWFCAPVQTQIGYEYPVGFGVLDGQGLWVVNPGTINTAASPVYSGNVAICYPLSSGYLVEQFFSQGYFVLQYNPSATYTVSLLSSYYGPSSGSGSYELPSSTCP